MAEHECETSRCWSECHREPVDVSTMNLIAKKLSTYTPEQLKQLADAEYGVPEPLPELTWYRWVVRFSHSMWWGFRRHLADSLHRAAGRVDPEACPDYYRCSDDCDW